MTGGIAEELLKLSLKYCPPLESKLWNVSEAWNNPNSTQEERSKTLSYDGSKLEFH
jgi:hypothetical protein